MYNQSALKKVSVGEVGPIAFRDPSDASHTYKQTLLNTRSWRILDQVIGDDETPSLLIIRYVTEGNPVYVSCFQLR